MSLSACATAQATQTAPAAVNINLAAGTSTNAPTQKPTQDAFAAVVNDQTITAATLDRQVSRRLEGIRSLGDPMPADQAAFRMTVLDSMIEQMLIEQAAKIQGINVTDADVEKELQDNIKIAGSKEKWQAQIAADRMTEAEYREGLRSALITQKMRDIVTAKIGPTAEQVHARHILVASEATANEILNKLKAKADFAQLAAQYSLDVTTKQTGGDLGWFSRGQLLQKAVEDAAFGLPDNQISAPVKSDLGYHIVQTLERVKDRPIDPETRFKLSEEAFEQWVQSLRKSARIQIFPNG
jgi:peptidyl-prolyl cis-trans isomerase C